jgi:predicted GIY-YIG superfamily endonuclease
MSLALPGDVEPFLTENFEQLRGPAVYALDVVKPDDVAAEWDRHFDARPEYMDELQSARDVLYVGATNDLLLRLEDHVEGDVRQSALLTVCDIVGVRDVVWFDDADRAFERENGIAMQLANELEHTYVHSR